MQSLPVIIYSLQWGGGGGGGEREREREREPELFASQTGAKFTLMHV